MVCMYGNVSWGGLNGSHWIGEPSWSKFLPTLPPQQNPSTGQQKTNSPGAAISQRFCSSRSPCSTMPTIANSWTSIAGASDEDVAAYRGLRGAALARLRRDGVSTDAYVAAQKAYKRLGPKNSEATAARAMQTYVREKRALLKALDEATRKKIVEGVKRVQARNVEAAQLNDAQSSEIQALGGTLATAQQQVRRLTHLNDQQAQVLEQQSDMHAELLGVVDAPEAFARARKQRVKIKKVCKNQSSSLH